MLRWLNDKIKVHIYNHVPVYKHIIILYLTFVENMTINVNPLYITMKWQCET